LSRHVLSKNLRAHGKSALFATNDAGRELDFVIQDDQRGYDTYHVSATPTPQNGKREPVRSNLADHWLQGGGDLLVSIGQ